MNKHENEMKIKHIYEKLGAPEMCRRPLDQLPGCALTYLSYELDNQPFALILKDNCDDC